MSTEFFRVPKFHQELRAKRMEMQPELSLGPTWPALGFAPASEKNTKQISSSSSESDGSSRKKRKHYNTWEEPVSHPHLELHLNDPLPLDWEQCLDLQSGKMYYLNRKTLKRSWNRPKEEGVNLELNMSTTAARQVVVADDGNTGATAPTLSQAAATKRSTAGGNMIAVPCTNCHLLVMLCKSYPTCPNCKFVQSLAPAPAPATPQAAAHRMLDAAVKPLQTLSLLH
ncbi:hypothetical protein CFC21_062665 [Triticum aestivum]|uniref:WW domain-containing protein n=4 Tax=Triticinae TaxID=1648030 RepID=A0A453IQW8_AEGTS|nr:uncharacterized protein LOC109743327 [Aegilops tauschii subsp. strangulata]XP_044378101.1 uncharacterized protein LOC123100204 [Triticum aestivum]KAF7055091.1 hypothetical protein CFC21_062665 [Triticum aestivum]